MSTPLVNTAAIVLAAGGPLLGKAAFVAVFVLLLIWLVFLPNRLIGQTRRCGPWWRSARFWAILITTIQIVVYIRWG